MACSGSFKCMSGKFICTIMTDQAFSVATMKDLVFLSVQHMVCYFHFIKNSRKKIGVLGAKESFAKFSNKVLMDYETKPRFDHYLGKVIALYYCFITCICLNVFGSLILMAL